jgi:DNA-3-methyladenine glycosylase II
MPSTILGKEEMANGISLLSLNNPNLKRLFNIFDVPELDIEKNYFWSLCRSIIYQQISGKAAKTISDRFIALFPSEKNYKPKEVLDINVDNLYGVGLSKQKASYIKNIAEAYNVNFIINNNFSIMTDAEIIKQLTNIKGIGRWTAEMFLIFTLRRSDVFPVTDLGVQKGFQVFYSLDELPSIDLMNEKAEKWRPYRTIVTLYLWYAVDGRFEW